MSRHVAEPWGQAKARLYMKYVDHFVPVSTAVREVLLRDGIAEHRISMAKAGCPALVASPSNNFKFDEFTVGIFGRLVHEKGLDIAIEASALSGTPLEIFAMDL